MALAREVLDAGVPLFGICFGSQILGRALGFGTYKLGYGHRGINQPVLDRATGKVEVTATTTASRSTRRSTGPIDTEFGGVEVSHVCLNDNVVGGCGCLDVPAFTRAVPPGGGGRPARRRLPVRPVRGR